MNIDITNVLEILELTYYSIDILFMKNYLSSLILKKGWSKADPRCIKPSSYAAIFISAKKTLMPSPLVVYY